MEQNSFLRLYRERDKSMDILYHLIDIIRIIPVTRYCASFFHVVCPCTWCFGCPQWCKGKGGGGV